MRRKSFLKRLGAKLLVATAVLLVLVTWVGEFLAIGPRAYMDKVALGRSPPAVEDLDAAYRVLEVSQLLRPWDANLQLEMGRLASWHLISSNPVESAKKWAALAESHLMQAASLRPSWGVPWSELIVLELRKQKPDLVSLLKAFQKGLYLTPWEHDAQPGLIWGGFAFWAALDYAQREQFMKIVAHGMQRNWGAVVDAAVRYHKEQHILDLIDPASPAHGRYQHRMRQRQVREKGPVDG